MTRTTVQKSIDLGPDALAIVGGGLSGMLTAWRVAERNPDITVHIFEAKPELEWKHHWSFNVTDIPGSLRDRIGEFAERVWDAYDVEFPRRSRRLNIGYASTNDLKLASLLEPLVNVGRIVMHRGMAVEPDAISAGAVLDARGYAGRSDTLEGYQKFVGLRIKTSEPHGVDVPLLMDARVEQVDGYRFVYLLPFSETEILVEDTYFSDAPHLGENSITARINDYIAKRGWKVDAIVHREKGILPMTTATTRDDGSAEIGLRGGLSIAATGFTFPAAICLAEHVAETISRHGMQAAEASVVEYRRRHIRNERYARLLNRMFFGAADPDRRYVILQRFYGFRESLIARFYRNELTLWDKARILIGKPPVPVSRAVYNMRESAYMRRQG